VNWTDSLGGVGGRRKDGGRHEGALFSWWQQADEPEERVKLYFSLRAGLLCLPSLFPGRRLASGQCGKAPVGVTEWAGRGSCYRGRRKAEVWREE